MMKKNLILLTSLSLFSVGCFKNESRSSKRMQFDEPNTAETEEVIQPVEVLDKIGANPKTIETIIIAIADKKTEDTSIAAEGDDDSAVEVNIPTIEDGNFYDDTADGDRTDLNEENAEKDDSETDSPDTEDKESEETEGDNTVVDLEQDLDGLIAQLEQDKADLQADIDKILEDHGFLKTLRDGWETILQYLFQVGSVEIESAIEKDVHALLATQQSYKEALAVVDADLVGIDTAIATENQKKALYSADLIHSLSDLKAIDTPSATETALIESIESYLALDAELQAEKKTQEVALEKRDFKLATVEGLKASKQAKEDRLALYALLLDSLATDLDFEEDIEKRIEMMSDIQAINDLVILDKEAVINLDSQIVVAELELRNAERNVQIAETLVAAKTAELTAANKGIVDLSEKADTESIAKLDALEKRKQELNSQKAQLSANLEQAKAATEELSQLLEAVRTAKAKGNVTG